MMKLAVLTLVGFGAVGLAAPAAGKHTYNPVALEVESDNSA